MKIAYIAHPIGGDVKGNIEKILEIVRNINRNEPDVVPFAPYIPDCLAIDDSDPKMRARGIKNDHELLDRVVIDELRVYGSRITAGMKDEIFKCFNKRIKVVPQSEFLAAQLNYLADEYVKSGIKK